jgi:starch phosphorylase
MKPVLTIDVNPRLPERLAALSRIAGNFWWDWNYSAVDLFRRIDPDLWDRGNDNPLYILQHCSQGRLDQLAADEGFVSHLDKVAENFREYMEEPRWFQTTYPDHGGGQVAYFSAEFGLAKCLQSYSGGLGILAGDHLKTASDLGLPLVAVGLAYRKGYFHQYLNIDGWQQERYDILDFNALPLDVVEDSPGKPLTIAVPVNGDRIHAAILRADVGRIPLYLLTTNVEANPPEFRGITDELYGGDNEIRIRQEIVLGLGGVRALEALGIDPAVFHMNEGHSAFLPFERIAALSSRNKLTFSEARELVQATTCFTTHTPVPAGNDMFSEELIEKHLGQLPEQLGLSWGDFMNTGRSGCLSGDNSFCMTVAAIKSAAYVNGVSKLHSQVARGMWHKIWEGVPEREIPISAITNGIHLYTWVSNDLATVFDRYVGSGWRTNPLDPEMWQRVMEIPDDELWRVHQTRRSRLVAFTRKALSQQVANRGAARVEVEGALEVLDPHALTIGFARRFATYKRAGMLFMDVPRLKALVGGVDQPIQFIFAGKAHPRDDAGKALIKDVIHHIRSHELRHRVVFLEDYDIQIARYLVQGCDIWLNTPRRPLEASGTSGMKAAANGALHMSVLDGWWDEAYDADCGWAIGSGEEYDDPEQQDRIECSALFNLIEQDAAELFYRRNSSGLPKDWIAMMKRSMAAYIPEFSSHRMLADYISEFYLPAAGNSEKLSAGQFSGARALSAWRGKVATNWDSINVASLASDRDGSLHVGDEVTFTAAVNLGELSADDVIVDLKTGVLNSLGEIEDGEYTTMQATAQPAGGVQTYSATITTRHSGRVGATVRILPHNASLPHKYAVFRAKWAG